MRRYRKFLTTFIDDGSNVNVHQEKINAMCGENEQSLEVSYLHLSRAAPILAIWTADAPKDMLEIFNEVTLQVTPLVSSRQPCELLFTFVGRARSVPRLQSNPRRNLCADH